MEFERLIAHLHVHVRAFRQLGPAGRLVLPDWLTEGFVAGPEVEAQMEPVRDVKRLIKMEPRLREGHKEPIRQENILLPARERPQTRFLLLVLPSGVRWRRFFPF